MQQARFCGNDQILIEEGPLPIASPGEVILHIERCALCGSEFKIWHSGHPRVPGHEMVGIVDAPGHPKHGRRCAVYIPVFCGSCEQCRLGHTHCCMRQRELVGWSRPGGYAQAVAVPEQCLLPVPDTVLPRIAPLLLDTVGTTAHALRLALGVVRPKNMLVLGAGPIGLGAILVAQSMGIERIFCTEPKAYRAAKAATFGAEIVTREDVGRYELVIEASGAKSARQLALESTQPYGVCVFLGESTEAWQIEENREVKLKDFFLIRSFYFPIGEYQDNLTILTADADRFGSLIDEEVGLAGLPALFSAFALGERLKPMLWFGGDG